MDAFSAPGLSGSRRSDEALRRCCEASGVALARGCTNTLSLWAEPVLARGVALARGCTTVASTATTTAASSDTTAVLLDGVWALAFPAEGRKLESSSCINESVTITSELNGSSCKRFG